MTSSLLSKLAIASRKLAIALEGLLPQPRFLALNRFQWHTPLAYDAVSIPVFQQGEVLDRLGVLTVLVIVNSFLL